MKKIITTIAIIALLSTTAFAQNANTLRGSLGIGSAIPAGGGLGLGSDLNLGWNIWDNLTAGARIGVAAMLNSPDPDTDNVVGAATNWHLLATGTYFFNPGNSGFALFGGVGLGPYFMASVSGGLGGAHAEAGAVFGCMLTAGFEAGRFRLAFEYHLVADTEILGAVGSQVIGHRNNNFWAVTVGFTFGGGGRWGR